MNIYECKDSYFVHSFQTHDWNFKKVRVLKRRKVRQSFQNKNLNRNGEIFEILLILKI